MDDRVKAAVSIIESEFAKPLREREVARRIGVSPSYFRHLFKTVMGVSFSRYVRQYRVARGNEMILQDPTLRSKDLSTLLGYKHVAAMDRDFKKCVGHSPRWVKKSVKSPSG